MTKQIAPPTLPEPTREDKLKAAIKLVQTRDAGLLRRLAQ